MKHKIILARTYVTKFEIEAEDSIQAQAIFDAMGSSIYEAELKQCNVVSETTTIESEDDNKRFCSVTGEEMTEGWVVNDGELYFKYENDATDWCIANDYAGLQSGFDADVIYWTEWED